MRNSIYAILQYRNEVHCVNMQWVKLGGGGGAIDAPQLTLETWGGGNSPLLDPCEVLLQVRQNLKVSWSRVTELGQQKSL